MSARRLRGVLVAATAVAVLQSCALGRAIVGAPSAPRASRQQALLDRRCGGCHDVPDPATMSGEAWLASLDRMKRRMTLPASEWDSLATMASPAPH